MGTTIPVTFFAPAKREPIDVVLDQVTHVSQTSQVRTFLNGTLNYLFVLNSRRQIVMASQNVTELIPGKTLGQIIGLRPGEALGCIHADECESGCGTSMFCHECGAVRVILAGLAGHRHMQECHLTCLHLGGTKSIDLRVLATPLLCGSERYTLMAAEKIRARRKSAARN